MSEPLELVLSKLEGVKRNGKGFQARCPAHEDRTPSLSVTEGADGQALLTCHAGCGLDAIVGALGMKVRDLFLTPLNGSTRTADQKREIASTYDYTDENGTTLYQTVRYIPKDFRQRRPDGKGGWIWNLEGAHRVLFHLPQLRAAIAAGQTVYLVEGEKDVQALEQEGVAATCNPMGAGKWHREYSEMLRDAELVIVQDRDEKGREHAAAVAKVLVGVARSCRIVEAASGKDAADHLQAGHTIAEFVASNPVIEPELDQEPEARPWPTAKPQAFYGLAGDLVRLIEPSSEADPMALLVQLLVAFGNALNRGPYFTVEATRHHLNLFAAIVGLTSRGRKGTAWEQVRRPMAAADEGWAKCRIMGGLSSGEGLIAQVRDPSEAPAGDMVATHDKRLLVLESELASTLRVMKREGSTLSALLRQAWDGSTLATLTKNNPMRAENAHISIIGHITEEELKRDLDRTELANGFLNRFLLVCAKRSKLLPEGGSIDDQALRHIGQRLHRALDFGRRCGELRRAPAARELWSQEYESLSTGWPGIFGAVISRAEAQVTRLSCLYAVLDESGEVETPHLEAALAVWAYCEDSARYVFGDSVGDTIADKILTHGRRMGELDMTAIRDLFGRNAPAEKIRTALSLLAKYDLSQPRTDRTGGRPREVWTFKSLKASVVRAPKGVIGDVARKVRGNDINDKTYTRGTLHPSSTTTYDINDINAETSEAEERGAIQAESEAA